MMANITGTGCMSAGVIGCCVGADPQALLPSCVCAMSAMGICGELAYEKLLSVDGGSGTYRVLLMNAMSKLDGATLTRRSKAERLRS